MSIFFAIKPPAGVSAALVATAENRARQLGGKPTREDTLHLTLAFLGEFPLPRLNELVAAAKNVHAPTFDLPIDRLGYWSHNQLLWAGMRSPPAGLMALAAQLETALIEAGCLAKETPGRHPFTPHITLVRKLGGPVSAEHLAMVDALAWSCTKCVLIRSLRSDTVPSYQTLEEFPLNPAA